LKELDEAMGYLGTDGVRGWRDVERKGTDRGDSRILGQERFIEEGLAGGGE